MTNTDKLSIIYTMILYTIGGLASLGTGYRIAKGGFAWNKTGLFITYGELNNLVALIFIVFGLLLISYAYKLKSKEYSICPYCEKIIEREKSSSSKCPACQTPIESLNGFYERKEKRVP